MATAHVKHGGVWVAFDGGHIKVKTPPPGQDTAWKQPSAISVKQGGTWVPTVLHWG